MMNQETNKKDSLKPYMLWLLIFTFIAPVGAAYWLYNVGGTAKTVNKGELISQPAQILDLNLQDKEGNTVDEKTVYGKWHMLAFVNSDCDRLCEEAIYKIRQTRIILHKESDRVVNVLVHLDKNIQPEFAKKLSTHYQHFSQFYGVKQQISDRLNLSADQLLASQNIFIVDPIGNIILKYKAPYDYKDFLADLKRLLKASQIG